MPAKFNRANYINVKEVKFKFDPFRSYIKFQHHSTHGSRYLIQCNERLHDIDGKRCYCNMLPQRSDRFEEWFMKNGHKCEPGEYISQQTLEQTLKFDENKISITPDMIYQEIALFTGKFNLALDVLSSDEFYELSLKLIAFGLQYKNDKNPLVKARTIYQPLRRYKLRQCLVERAFEKHREIINRFANLIYTSLAIDEGATCGFQNLHLVLEAPNTELPSYPFDTIRMNGGKAINYVESISLGFDLLSQIGISIGTVVCDGNTAQKKAFNFNWKKSLRFQNIKDIEKVIYIPCLCHRCDNAYKFAAGKNKDLMSIVADLHKVEKKCHDNQDVLGSICPSHCSTRWIYDYDIVCFIINNAEEIIQKFNYKDFPLDNFVHLKKCLVIFKTLVSIFETSKTKFKMAFLYLERGINALFELSREQNNPYASCLAYSLQNYTLKSEEAGLWVLGYCFTITGHDDLRKRISNQKNPYPKGYLDYFDFDLPPEEPIKDDFPMNLEEILITVNGAEANENNSQDTEKVPQLDDDEPCDLPDGDDIIIEPAEPFTDYIQCAKNTLRKLLKMRKLKKDEIDRCIMFFNQYIDDTNPFKDFNKSDDEYSWFQIRFASNEYRDIADIALRLLSSAVSEASCERTIKKQRLIHTKRRLRSFKQLLDARLILSSLTF